MRQLGLKSPHEDQGITHRSQPSTRTPGWFKPDTKPLSGHATIMKAGESWTTGRFGQPEANNW